MKDTLLVSGLHTVRLPRLDATVAHSLATAIVAAAEGKALSDGAREALDDVRRALDALASEATRRLSAMHEEKPDKRQADIALDAAWSSTYGFLDCWAKLPTEPERALVASRLRDRLFPDGLKFTQLRFTMQWAESERRLHLIESERLDQDFERLRGEAFLRALRETHRVYGQALGITKATEPRADEPRLRDLTVDLADALRLYVLQVTAMVRKIDPATTELAEKLLLPIATWESRPARHGQSAQNDEYVAESVHESGK